MCNELSFANQKVRTELAAVYLCCRMTEDADQIESVLYMLVFFNVIFVWILLICHSVNVMVPPGAIFNCINDF